MRIIACAASLLALVAVADRGFAAAGAVPPKFAEETATAGLDSVYQGEWQYMVGGGAAAFDCNDDGFDDLFLAGGEAPAKFYVNASTSGGALQFKPEQSGLELDKVTGAYPLDIDNDGKMDLVLLRVGENIAMRGLGNCRFEPANKAWGFDGGDGWSTALAATWEKGTDWPTIAIGNYIDRTEEISPWGSCTDNWLHRPRTDGTGFAEPQPLKPSFCPLSMMFSDWNRSGTPSLRVSNDREYYEGGQEQMWRVERGTAPALYTDKDGWKYLRIWGMGIASNDLDGDTYPEYFLTSMADSKLQTLAEIPADGKPKPGYKDVAFAKGVTAHRPYMGDDLRPSTGWHTQFEDVNNDGYVDLFIAKGNVAKMPDFAAKDPNNLLVQGPDGKFTEAGGTSGVGDTAVSRGAALADFNLDGLVDLVVVNRWEPAKIWRNETPGAGNWVQLKLAQPGANRNGVGAWVEVKSGDRLQRREITVGGGHVSGQAGWIHFGIGDAKDAEIRVQWPNGEWSPTYKVAANGFALLERGKAEATPWQPK
jgi:hypothetical protein